MDDNNSRTLWCGNLAEQVTEEILYELFLQAAPVEKVTIPNGMDGKPMNYGFITFKHEMSIHYALRLLNGIRLFDKYILVQYRNIKPAVESNGARIITNSPKQPLNLGNVDGRHLHKQIPQKANVVSRNMPNRPLNIANDVCRNINQNQSPNMVKSVARNLPNQPPNMADVVGKNMPHHPLNIANDVGRNINPNQSPNMAKAVARNLPNQPPNMADTVGRRMHNQPPNMVYVYGRHLYNQHQLFS